MKKIVDDFGEQNFVNALRQSIQLSNPRRIDYDLRSNSYLASLRKLFEEFRIACEQGSIEPRNMHEINGEAIFAESVKTFDGLVFKEDFIYSLL